MSELVRKVQSNIANPDVTTAQATGSAIAKTAVGAGGLWFVAGALPLVNFPALVLIALFVGLYLRFGR